MYQCLDLKKWKMNLAVSAILAVIYYLLGQNILLALAGGAAAFAVLTINFRFILKNKAVLTGILVFISPFYLYFLVEILNHHFPWKGSPTAIFFNIVFYLSFIILAWAVSNHIVLACFIASGITFVLGAVNYFVQIYRDAAFSVYDILAFRTAMNVLSGGMELLTDWVMAAGLAGFVLYWLFLIKNYYKGPRKGPVNYAARAILGVAVIVFYVATIKYDLMENAGVNPNEYHGNEVNGFMVHFIVSYKVGKIEEPAGYGHFLQEMVPETAQTQPDEELPNIIVIMNESFADYRVFDKCTTDKPFMPYFDSLKENTVKGYALASVHGGGTANSEWEFLMGNTMAFMPSSSVPYQIYMNTPKSSLTRTLLNKGYQTVAMHPYDASGWNRRKAWQNLGFQETYFLDDFQDYQLLNDKMTDQSNYDEIIKRYEAKELKLPFFLFNVTIQNHTGGYYDVAEQLGYSISFTGGLAGKNPYEEGYFTLIHESDKAFGNLVEYFKKQNEKTVIMMYGDHQPGAGDSFLEQVFDRPVQQADVEERQKMYTVPFVIWANYDIEEKEYELTSLNYLSSILLDSIGIKGTGYNQYLLELMKDYPAINAFGYYRDNAFYPISNYKEIEDTNIMNYQYLQYNNMFDLENYNKEFFE